LFIDVVIRKDIAFYFRLLRNRDDFRFH